MVYSPLSMPNLPRYGANELKRHYRPFLMRALLCAACIHLAFIGLYWLASSFKKEEPQTKAIRITKYNELIPLINQIEKEYEAMLSGGGTGAEWSSGINGGNVIITGEGSGPGLRQAERAENSASRRLAREVMSREVSQKGLLGILESSGGAGSGGGGGEGVGAYTADDLERAMSSLGEGDLAYAGSGNGNGGGSGTELMAVEGSRSARQATIDDLVAGEKGIRSQAISRKGELQIESASEAGETGRRSINRSTDVLQKVLLTHVPAIRYCYERELKRNPELKGKLTVRITLSPDGSVKNAEIAQSTMQDERVERCILSRIRQWKDFPAVDLSEGDVTFKQVYSFGY